MTPNSSTDSATRDGAEVVAKIQQALDAGPTPGPWLYRGKSNSFHKPPPEGTAYTYGDFIIRVGSDEDDDSPQAEANVDFIAAVNPDAIRTVLTLLATSRAEVERLRARVDSLQKVTAEMLEFADYWPGIAYTADLEARTRAALSTKKD